MAYEKLIKRTIWVAKCEACGEQKEADKDPPKSRMCSCGRWVDFVEQSAIGPDLTPEARP